MESNQTPYQRFTARFTPLYRTLLIIAIISAVFSLASVLNLRQPIDYLTRDLFYALSGLIMLVVVTPLMVASVILLWQKHPRGIMFRQVGYAVSIIAAILGLFTLPSTVTELSTTTLERLETQATTQLSPDLIRQSIELGFYGAYWLTITISLLFAWLWWKAWKTQIRRDQKRSSSKASS